MYIACGTVTVWSGTFPCVSAYREKNTHDPVAKGAVDGVPARGRVGVEHHERVRRLLRRRTRLDLPCARLGDARGGEDDIGLIDGVLKGDLFACWWGTCKSVMYERDADTRRDA